MAAKKDKSSTNGAPRAPSISPEDFVTKWQGCSTNAEAKAALGPGASSRAKRMRDAGVKLKALAGSHKRINAGALNALINSL